MEQNNLKKKLNDKTALALVVLTLAIVGVIVITYLFVAGLTYLVCLGFGLQWSWFTALGVLAACVLLRWILSASKSGGGK